MSKEVKPLNKELQRQLQEEVKQGFVRCLKCGRKIRRENIVNELGYCRPCFRGYVMNPPDEELIDGLDGKWRRV